MDGGDLLWEGLLGGRGSGHGGNATAGDVQGAWNGTWRGDLC